MLMLPIRFTRAYCRRDKLSLCLVFNNHQFVTSKTAADSGERPSQDFIARATFTVSGHLAFKKGINIQRT